MAVKELLHLTGLSLPNFKSGASSKKSRCINIGLSSPAILAPEIQAMHWTDSDICRPGTKDTPENPCGL